MGRFFGSQRSEPIFLPFAFIDLLGFNAGPPWQA
jgi:hypothetical protein